MKGLQVDFGVIPNKKDIGIVKVRGSIDLKTSTLFNQYINKIIKLPQKILIFDLKELKYVNSTGFGILASAIMNERDKGEKGKKILLCNMSPQILAVYNILGMDQICRVFSSIEEAIKHKDEAYVEIEESEPEIEEIEEIIEEKEEQIKFPLESICPQCENQIVFESPGKYTCANCNTALDVDEKGNVNISIEEPKSRLSLEEKIKGEFVKDEIEITLPSDVNHLSKVRDFIFSFFEDYFNEKERGNMSMAVDEACANAIEHAHNFDRNKKLYMLIVLTPTKATITIKDSGENTFNKIIHRDKISTEELKKIGRGMGLIIIKQLMDEVDFKPTEKWGTSIVMTKYIKK